MKWLRQDGFSVLVFHFLHPNTYEKKKPPQLFDNQNLMKKNKIIKFFVLKYLLFKN